MFKKGIIFIVSLISLVLFTSCFSLFTALTIEEPYDKNSSMVILESGSGGAYLMNDNYTGWAPLVRGPSQQLVPFKMVNALADGETLYVAANVEPGTYTLLGFRHVYTDYSLLTDEDIPIYEPYVETPYHVNQDFMLDEPVVIEIKKGEVTTFGYYDIQYTHNGGGFADTDDRWAVIPSSVIINADPENTNMLRVVKGFDTPSWRMWNERNNERAY